MKALYAALMFVGSFLGGMVTQCLPAARADDDGTLTIQNLKVVGSLTVQEKEGGPSVTIASIGNLTGLWATSPAKTTTCIVAEQQGAWIGGCCNTHKQGMKGADFAFAASPGGCDFQRVIGDDISVVPLNDVATKK